MPSVPIDNPILNSPYHEPTRHFRFDADDQLTNQIDPGRRGSSYFLPIAAPKKKAAPGLFDELEEKRTESDHVNRIRQQVNRWRERGWPDVTAVTRALLEHWHAEDRFRRLFFCQTEALETLIFITEVARQTGYGQDWIEKYLREKANEAQTPLFRIASKMATGSGKTVVMAMLVAWQVLNKRRSPHDKRFTDAFLVVAPGITIRDRLRVLLPSDPNNYYKELDLVPPEHRGDLGTARIVITNFHAFKLREKGDAGGLTRRLLTAHTPGAFTESPQEMVNRVCADLGRHREIMVINDEAHHCYRSNPAAAREKMTREEASEAKARAEEARLWITGLEAVHARIGVKTVFDLSATPFYLKGSGYPEGTLFPWVVSDFSLMDAIECGIVKVPRVPIADNALTGDYPRYRDLWVHIREGLRDVRRGPEDAHRPPLLPGLLEGALKSLYNHYQEKFRDWEADEEGRANGSTPPVFIVVCNNTNVSKAVFDHIAGHETEHCHPDGESVVAPGALPLFNNEDGQRWRHRPNTILVDSRQLESGESMSDDFKKLSAHLIEDFKAEYRRRFPGRDAESLTDEDLMREVLNTVGKKGKLGEHVRCVVSVSMLTEGWDCLDADTEILTPDGWVGRGGVAPGDSVYSLNRLTGCLEVVPVLEYGERPVRPDERMTRLKSQHLDIRVTEGHEFHVKYRDPRRGGALSRNYLTLTGRDLAARRSSFALPLAAELAEPFVGLPLSDDELRFVAWFMTDGGFSGPNVVIAQSKRWRDDIRSLLSRLGLDFTERVLQPRNSSYANAQPLHTFRIPKGTHTGSLARRGWSKYAEYLHKAVAPVLHRMTRAQFLVFWTELLKGDGEQQEGKSGWLWCDRTEQADAYTHLAVVRGLTVSCHPELTAAGKTVYRVCVRDSQWLTSDPADPRATKVVVESALPGEVVWCIKNQNSTIVTRRGGKVAILGNCNTVTHILGVRAFGTRLLCEQVMGRGLRRRSYTVDEDGLLTPEYADIFGVPFSGFPVAGLPEARTSPTPKPGKAVRAVPERLLAAPWLEVAFPRVVGYHFDVPAQRLSATFDSSHREVLTTQDIPTHTLNAPIVGRSEELTLEEAQALRPQAVAFRLATHLQRHHFPDRPWLFPQLLDIVRDWLGDPEGHSPNVDYGDDTFPGLLLLGEKKHAVGEKIARAIIAASGGVQRLRAELPSSDFLGSTVGVSFDTIKDCWTTDPTKCHFNLVPQDSDWETIVCAKLEELAEVRAYVKNQGLGFRIPYTCDGRPGHYYPDLIVKLDDGRADLLNLVLEVSGQRKKEKEAKVQTTRTMWVPGVNNLGTFGRWAFLEIDAANLHKTKQEVLKLTRTEKK